MFYSARSDVLSTPSSHIEFDRIFCGQYWDELSAASYLGGKAKERTSVLMLGLAYGAAVRPILATGRVNRLVGVDCDESMLASCRALYSSSFPEITFEAQRADAKAFLANNMECFDVVVADLYGHDAYADCMLDDEFYDLVEARVASGGHIVVNGYGIPAHLSPLEGNSPQRLIARKLQRRWNEVYFLPYRRNLTFVAGAEIRPLRRKTPSKGLRLADALYLDILEFRLRFLERIQVHIGEVDSDSTRYVSIDHEMRTRWQQVLVSLKPYVDGKVSLDSPAALRALLADPELCWHVQRRLAVERSPLMRVLPILVAGEMNCSPIDASWLIDWTIEVLREQELHHDFVCYCLPQAYAAVINGNNQYRDRVFQFREAVSKVLEADSN